MTKEIRFQYQVKQFLSDRYEVKELIHPCDPNKSDKENLDDAYSKACELGCDPQKNVKWEFVN